MRPTDTTAGTTIDSQNEVVRTATTLERLDGPNRSSPLEPSTSSAGDWSTPDRSKFRTVWKFKSHTYERPRPELVSLDGGGGGVDVGL